MNFEHRLKLGETINNDQLTSIFRCSTQGGMRRSLETETLVIVSNHIKSIYSDRWVREVLHYTGMGMKGDQGLDAAQNRTLNQSSTNGVSVYLFEVFQDKQYTFCGQVRLADKPYQEEQPDQEGRIRKVWVFPLKVIGGKESFFVDSELLTKKQRVTEKQARRLSNEELQIRARYANTGGIREVSTKTYERSPYVSELAKRRASGVCALCRQPAPFKDKRGHLFLETHHIKWLSNGGEDTTENTVALCPNCHRKMHALNLPQDVKMLKQVTHQ